MAIVIRTFRDRVTWRRYAPGDEYDGDARRVAELAGNGFLSISDEIGPERTLQEQTDALPALGDMTCAELRALCSERGIMTPKRATKAQLITLLDG